MCLVFRVDVSTWTEVYMKHMSTCFSWLMSIMSHVDMNTCVSCLHEQHSLQHTLQHTLHVYIVTCRHDFHDSCPYCHMSTWTHVYMKLMSTCVWDKCLHDFHDSCLYCPKTWLTTRIMSRRRVLQLQCVLQCFIHMQWDVTHDSNYVT